VLADEVDLSRDNALIATAGQDGKVRVYDGASYRELMTLPSHAGASTFVKFTPDGNWLVSAGDDGRVVRWDLRRPSRTVADLTRLVRCRVPLRFEGDDVLPRELDVDDPTCHDPL
jgi:WD40 repeat protein